MQAGSRDPNRLVDTFSHRCRSRDPTPPEAVKMLRKTILKSFVETCWPVPHQQTDLQHKNTAASSTTFFLIGWVAIVPYR